MSTQACTRDGRCTFPRAELEKYRGKWVAFALDGSRILAFGDTEIELAEKAETLGLTSADYVMEPIPAHDTLIL